MDITNIITGFTGATPRVPGSNAVGLVYPASFDYQNSMNQGATALVKAVADYLAENRCPESKISILGYSQVRDHVSKLALCVASTVLCVSSTTLTCLGSLGRTSLVRGTLHR